MAKTVSFHHQRRIKKTSKDKEALRGVSSVPRIYVDFLLGRKVASLFLSPGKPIFRLAFLCASLWLGVGAAVFGSSYLIYLKSRQQRLMERQQLLLSQSTWKRILSSHPTSREALLGAYATSYGLGENDQATRYLELLERLDPNDTRVKNLSTK